MTTKRPKLEFKDIKKDEFVLMHRGNEKILLLVGTITAKKNKEFSAEFIGMGTGRSGVVFGEENYFVRPTQKEIKIALKNLRTERENMTQPIDKQITRLEKEITFSDGDSLIHLQ
jgi:hypothetical protein